VNLTRRNFDARNITRQRAFELMEIREGSGHGIRTVLFKKKIGKRSNLAIVGKSLPSRKVLPWPHVFILTESNSQGGLVVPRSVVDF